MTTGKDVRTIEKNVLSEDKEEAGDPLSSYLETLRIIALKIVISLVISAGYALIAHLAFGNWTITLGVAVVIFILAVVMFVVLAIFAQQSDTMDREVSSQ